MNTVKKILSGLLIIVLIFVSGFFSGYFYDSIKSDQAVQEIKKGPVITNQKNVNVEKLTLKEKDDIINCIYKSQFVLDINKISGKGNYQILGSICNLTATRNINIPVAKSGNFKFYLGLGLGIAGTGLLCYGAYKIFKG